MFDEESAVRMALHCVRRLIEEAGGMTVVLSPASEYLEYTSAVVRWDVTDADGSPLFEVNSQTVTADGLRRMVFEIKRTVQQRAPDADDEALGMLVTHDEIDLEEYNDNG